MRYPCGQGIYLVGFNKFMRALFAIFLFCSTAVAQAAGASPVQGLLQMLDYLAVDYRGAVVDGEVVHPSEYGEMQDFAAGIILRVDNLDEGPAKGALGEQATQLRALVDRLADGTEIAELAATMRGAIVAAYPVNVVPRKEPNLQRAAQLYAAHCARCHGADGRGDGVDGAAMQPPPINFHDRERHSQRTVFGLYNTITIGVSGTAMPAFGQLGDDDRWALAFYVGQLAASGEEIDRGASLWRDGAPETLPVHTLKQTTTLSPMDAAAEFGQDGRAVLAYLRSNPAVLYALQPSPLDVSRTLLHDALDAYRGGDHERAYRLAVSAYLEGFELIEGRLTAAAPELLHQVEKTMTELRGEIRAGKETTAIAGHIALIEQQIDEAEAVLSREELDDATAFTSAVVVLLREGLEAILVIAAIAAFLVRTGRRDGMRYLHFGWIVALLAGVVTWWAATSLWAMSGATRELSEAIATLVAAVVLFYVGFWLHSKTNAARWQQFIETNVSRALDSTTLWSLSFLAFITVYREAFETILFYQALWSQAAAGARDSVVSGFVTSVVILALLAWLIMRYSARLPLRQFFAATGVLVFVLAVIFAGKGTAALQSAGVLHATTLKAMPRIELLGIFPTAEGLAVQLALIVIAAIYFLRGRARSPSNAAGQ